MSEHYCDDHDGFPIDHPEKSKYFLDEEKAKAFYKTGEYTEPYYLLFDQEGKQISDYYEPMAFLNEWYKEKIDKENLVVKTFDKICNRYRYEEIETED